MKNKLMCVLAFSLGAAAGVAVSYKVLKTKYEQITREEIESVKDYYRNREPLANEEVFELEGDEEDEEGEEPTVVHDFGPYVISPDEYGDMYDYNTAHLTFYAEDEVLSDENDEMIDDIDSIIGLDSLDHFGDYEDDVLFVRNDKLKTDYEIFYDKGSYYNVLLDILYKSDQE